MIIYDTKIYMYSHLFNAKKMYTLHWMKALFTLYFF